MKRRLGEAVAAMLMWCIFGAGVVLYLVVMPLLIIRYVIVGTESARNAVKLPGKALDQAFNCIYFHGHPKETLSSHAGRWLFEAPERAPWWVPVVATVTAWFEENHVQKAVEAPFLGTPLE